jgi:hypothetical protein
MGIGQKKNMAVIALCELAAKTQNHLVTKTMGAEELKYVIVGKTALMLF